MKGSAEGVGGGGGDYVGVGGVVEGLRVIMTKKCFLAFFHSLRSLYLLSVVLNNQKRNLFLKVVRGQQLT